MRASSLPLSALFWPKLEEPEPFQFLASVKTKESPRWPPLSIPSPPSQPSSSPSPPPDSLRARLRPRFLASLSTSASAPLPAPPRRSSRSAPQSRPAPGRAAPSDLRFPILAVGRSAGEEGLREAAAEEEPGPPRTASARRWEEGCPCLRRSRWDTLLLLAVSDSPSHTPSESSRYPSCFTCRLTRSFLFLYSPLLRECYGLFVQLDL